MALVFAIPTAYRFAILVFVKALSLVVIAMLIVPFSVALALALSESCATRCQAKPKRETQYPFS